MYVGQRNAILYIHEIPAFVITGYDGRREVGSTRIHVQHSMYAQTNNNMREERSINGPNARVRKPVDE